MRALPAKLPISSTRSPQGNGNGTADTRPAARSFCLQVKVMEASMDKCGADAARELLLSASLSHPNVVVQHSHSGLVLLRGHIAACCAGFLSFD